MTHAIQCISLQSSCIAFQSFACSGYSWHGTPTPIFRWPGATERCVRLLAQRFQELEVVALPDRVFRISQVESALLIAKEPRTDDHNRVLVSYTEVRDKDREHFLTAYGYTRRESQTKTSQEAEESLTVIALREIWERLCGLPAIRRRR